MQVLNNAAFQQYVGLKKIKMQFEKAAAINCRKYVQTVFM